jgi:archaellum biogenesis ATPase FlaH
MDLLNPEKIEPIMFKLLLSDPKYATLLGEIYEKEWLQDAEIGKVCSAIIKFYQQKNALPKYQTVDLIASKLYPESYSELSVKLKAAYNIDISEYDREYLDGELLSYVRNCGIYWTIMSNVEEMSETHSVEGMIDNLKDLTTMNFDFDLGLDYLEDIEAHCDALTAEDCRLSSGWDEFDQISNGGFYAEGRCLAVFVGETHVGKSLMLSNLAANMIKMGKFVVIISLEMCEDVYASRIDAHLTKGNINELEFNTDKVIDTAKNIKGNHPDAKLVIKEYPPDSITCNHVKAYIDKLSSFHKRQPDCVIIDYINLLIPANNGSGNYNSYEKYKIVTTEMRRLSYIFNTPVISVTQCNRSGMNNTEIGLEHISDSAGIAMTADFVGVLFQREGDREAEILNMKIAKNRLGGRVGQVMQFHIDYSNLAISDIASQIQCPNSVADDVMAELEDYISIGDE